MSQDPSTEARLVTATLKLIAQHGVRGATTRRIAAEAGVNEVTIFRTFGNKANLINAAIARFASRFAGVGQETLERDDLREALERLAVNYLSAITEHPGVLVRLLPELREDTRLVDTVKPQVATFAGKILGFFGAQQRAGNLRGDNPTEAAMAFMGPLLARALMGEMIGVEPHLDPAGYVASYLDGHGVA